jgi:hypothetical protein
VLTVLQQWRRATSLLLEADPSVTWWDHSPISADGRPCTSAAQLSVRRCLLPAVCVMHPASGFLQVDDLAPALEALRRKLMERNVASEIADK